MSVDTIPVSSLNPTAAPVAAAPAAAAPTAPDAAVSPGGRGGVGPSAAGAAGASANPMALKVNQEVLTSLHLIKDIRRLEKYQRDFFLKVKESLTHVHVLLDHQLMDMAWSDNLSDCEENLLKVSTHVATTPSSQLADVYNILLHDREKLSARFQELSVKSSVSEFVVNSRQLLDINAVRMAAEAILKNEKPVPAQGDHSIPVDHTFFLANFCTTSLASSMMASFVPKPSAASAVAAASQLSATAEAFQHQPRYDKKVNGAVVADPGNANGGGVPEGGEYVAAPPTAPPPGVPPPVSGSNMYGEVVDANANSAMDKYLQHAAAVAGINIDAASVAAAAAVNANGMYGATELVTAISQIASQPPPVTSAPVVTVAGAGQGKGPATKPAAPIKKKHGDPWGQKNMTDEQGTAPPSSGEEISVSRERYARTTSGGSGTGQYPKAAAGGATIATTSSGGSANELSLPDASSEAVTDTDDDESRGGAAGGGGGGGDRGPPLSFARIASLNIGSDRRAAIAAGSSQVQRRPAPAAASRQLQQQQQPVPQPKAGSVPPQQQQQQQQPQQTLQQQQQQQQMIYTGQQQQQQQQLQQQAMQQQVAAAASQLQQQMSPPSHIMMAPPPPAMMAPQGPPPPHLQYNHHQMAAQAHMMQAHIPTLPSTNNPRFYFDISMEGKRLGRVIIEVQSAVAPKMAMNFSMLVTGEKGFGYKGCQFFQAWRNESVICGDWEHNSGRGGRAALEPGPLFTPDDTRLPCIRGAVGMRRMSKKHSSLNQVASQFRIILANMNTQFTGIFGHIVSGIEALDKVADMGGEGGRPEKSAVVTQCGIYKS